MSAPETACAHCGAHQHEKRMWLVRIYNAVNGVKNAPVIDLSKLATDVEELVARVRGLEK